MKQIIITILLICFGVLFLGSDCEPLSFEPTSFFGTVKVSQIYYISGNEVNFHDEMLFDFGDELDEIGIDYSDIESVTVQNIELIFNNISGPDPIVFSNLNVLFTKTGEAVPYDVMQIPGPYSNTFSAINGVVFNPHSADAMLVLGTVPAGITELTDYLSVMPPRSFTGSVNLNGIGAAMRPADFMLEVSFYIQVQYSP